MKLLNPTAHKRLNEALAFVFLFFGLAIMLSLISYSAADPSWNTAATLATKPSNLLGRFGAYLSDVCFQIFGLSSFVLPALIMILAWKWMQSKPIEAAWVKVTGAFLFMFGACTSFSLAPGARAASGSVSPGGLFGILLSDLLVRFFNFTGAALITATVLVVSLYLISTFSIAILLDWISVPVAIFKFLGRIVSRIRLPRFKFNAPKLARAKALKTESGESLPLAVQRRRTPPRLAEDEGVDTPPWETKTVSASVPAFEAREEDEAPHEDFIPIKTLEDIPPAAPAPSPNPSSGGGVAVAIAPSRTKAKEANAHTVYKLPPTGILNEPQARSAFDSQELRDTASRIKERFEEFGVLGNVVQINPGPVVTTFEFKPEAGIKYSKITNLTEDLCLGLQAESILIERIPGKPTIGIEVPNRKSEVIALREVIEGEDFQTSTSHLTMSLGKDINGRIKTFTLDTMPHLLVAGSTGSGKSVMLNSMIMSVLYKSTPEEVRMIMIDPKRVELGIYEDIPHLLTPVITDPRKASNALRNAVLEMERRYKLLASHGVRNIEQFNRKMRQMANEPRSLFDDDNPDAMLQEDLRPLPYILIIIDELADLMMLERNNVETSVARLAQMARAVGMHLVLATQRPSVDVITGVIKANFPARISFRVATRVDSRTILDTMGAEHLLGKGDMLFLPPASSRLHRVHGAYVGEQEINSVVEFWKRQARPEYDQSFLVAPPNENGEEPSDSDVAEGDSDPLYNDAVKVVCEMGKASTSILQRRLRLGYGRAARMLDRMQKEGIIGPPDGSRPREVLKHPDWLNRDMRHEAPEDED